jgi:hypothetical protein
LTVLRSQDEFQTLVLFVSIVGVNWAIADGKTNWCVPSFSHRPSLLRSPALASQARRPRPHGHLHHHRPGAFSASPSLGERADLPREQVFWYYDPGTPLL